MTQDQDPVGSHNDPISTALSDQLELVALSDKLNRIWTTSAKVPWFLGIVAITSGWGFLSPELSWQEIVGSFLIFVGLHLYFWSAVLTAKRRLRVTTPDRANPT